MITFIIIYHYKKRKMLSVQEFRGGFCVILIEISSIRAQSVPTTWHQQFFRVIFRCYPSLLCCPILLRTHIVCPTLQWKDGREAAGRWSGMQNVLLDKTLRVTCINKNSYLKWPIQLTMIAEICLARFVPHRL